MRFIPSIYVLVGFSVVSSPFVGSDYLCRHSKWQLSRALLQFMNLYESQGCRFAFNALTRSPRKTAFRGHGPSGPQGFFFFALLFPYSFYTIFHFKSSASFDKAVKALAIVIVLAQNSLYSFTMSGLLPAAVFGLQVPCGWSRSFLNLLHWC